MSRKMKVFIGLVCIFAVAIIFVFYPNIKDGSIPVFKEYPQKPITIIVPYTAGGGPDALAREMAKEAVKHLGQPLIVQNVPGGGATIGWNELARSKPDGYTIGLTTMAALLQPLYCQTRYHYPTALEPLAQVTQLPVVVAVLSTQPWENINNLVEFAKQNPNKIKYAHPGLGTVHHVVGEMLAKDAGIQMAQVPFIGPSEALTALLGEHVQVLLTSPPAVKEYIKNGKVKVLAISTEQRITDPGYETVPTFKEQGLNIVFGTWYGIGAPKMMPDEVKSKLAFGLAQIINDPEFKKNMENMGMQVEYLGPEECKQKWIDETSQLTKIVKETGISDLIAAQKY